MPRSSRCLRRQQGRSCGDWLEPQATSEALCLGPDPSAVTGDLVAIEIVAKHSPGVVSANVSSVAETLVRDPEPVRALSVERTRQR
jgi:hypothetical protein